MSASATDIATLRRMVAEPTEATYTDEILTAAIETYPLDDSDGYDPDDSLWTPTYDLHAAAGDVWEEKAAAIASNYDFTGDGHTLSRSQVFTAFKRMARSHYARMSVSTHSTIALRDDTDETLTN